MSHPVAKAAVRFSEAVESFAEELAAAALGDKARAALRAGVSAWKSPQTITRRDSTTRKESPVEAFARAFKAELGAADGVDVAGFLAAHAHECGYRGAAWQTAEEADGTPVPLISLAKAILGLPSAPEKKSKAAG